MESFGLAKQIIAFNKSAFDNSFNTIVLMQEQIEKRVQNLLQQVSWLPEEGKKVLNEWMTAYKKGRDEYKKAVDESFKKVDVYFAKAEETTDVVKERVLPVGEHENVIADGLYCSSRNR